MRNYLGLLDGQELVEGYDHYIWMSDRCLEGIAWCKKNGLDYEIVPKNWKTAQEIRACMDYLDKVKKVVLSHAAKILNEYHHTDFDEEQWNILLTQWLNLYLASYYDKYLKLKQVERMGAKCACDLYETDVIVPSLDFLDYSMLLSQTDAYHVYQYTRLYQEMQPFGALGVRVNTIYKRPSLPTKPELSSKHTKAWWFKQTLLFCKKTARKYDAVVLLNSYLPGRLVMRSMLKTFGSVMDYTGITDYTENERYELSLDVDTKWRETESAIVQGEDEFVALMCRLLRKELPVAYVEEFPFLQERALGKYRYAMQAKAVLFTSTSCWYDELFKIYLMNVKREKALLCGIEHGGIEGIDVIVGMNSEYEICDTYYTWGYSKAGNPTFIGMPSEKMVSVFVGNSIPPNSITDILYISYCCSKNVFRIEPEELIFDKTIGEEREFLLNLPAEIKRNMRIRLFPSAYGWEQYSDLRELDGLRIDNEPNFYKSLESAHLVILEWWQTTIAEALLANKAVIVRRSPVCVTEYEALDDLKALKDAGILVESFQEMNERLADILPDIDAWWNDSKRQRVINNFRSKYLCSLSDGEKRWHDELVRLANL